MHLFIFSKDIYSTKRLVSNQISKNRKKYKNNNNGNKKFVISSKNFPDASHQIVSV